MYRGTWCLPLCSNTCVSVQRLGVSSHLRPPAVPLCLRAVQPQTCLYKPPGGELTKVPAVPPSWMSRPGPPRSQPTRAWPTQHRPLWRTRPFKEPTVLEEASLTAAHLGPGWGGPGRGGFSLIVFRHQLWRLESQTAERGPEAPWSRARPQAVSHEGPSWDPPYWPLPFPAITIHQAPGLPPASRVWVLSKLHRGKQGGSSTPLHSPTPMAPGHCQAQSSTQRFDAHGDPTHPAAFVQRKI